jgi:uncharacterized membrane protein
MHMLLEETPSTVLWIEYAALAMEALAILVILAGIIYGGIKFALALLRRADGRAAYQQLKAFMGRTLLLGLEILVAADIVRTVALTPTFESVTVLGILVLIRTFLGWSIIVEIEGRWPWQEAAARAHQERQTDTD